MCIIRIYKTLMASFTLTFRRKSQECPATVMFAHVCHDTQQIDINCVHLSFSLSHLSKSLGSIRQYLRFYLDRLTKQTAIWLQALELRMQRRLPAFLLFLIRRRKCSCCRHWSKLSPDYQRIVSHTECFYRHIQ